MYTIFVDLICGGSGETKITQNYRKLHVLPRKPCWSDFQQNLPHPRRNQSIFADRNYGTVRTRLCDRLASIVVVCRLMSVRNVLWLNGAS